jgi:hypothetical protein
MDNFIFDRYIKKAKYSRDYENIIKHTNLIFDILRLNGWAINTTKNFPDFEMYKLVDINEKTYELNLFISIVDETEVKISNISITYEEVFYDLDFNISLYLIDPAKDFYISDNSLFGEYIFIKQVEYTAKYIDGLCLAYFDKIFKKYKIYSDQENLKNYYDLDKRVKDVI